MKGYICFVGYYCLEGAVKEIKCDIGIYGFIEGLGKFEGGYYEWMVGKLVDGWRIG